MTWAEWLLGIFIVIIFGTLLMYVLPEDDSE